MWSITNRAISHYYITEVYGPNKAALVSVKVHICFDHSTFAIGPRFTFKMFATHVKALTQADLSSSLVA